MHKIVISDTSCLIILHKIKELDLLRKVYETVSTTPEVAQEFSEELPESIIDELLRKTMKWYEAMKRTL